MPPTRATDREKARHHWTKILECSLVQEFNSISQRLEKSNEANGTWASVVLLLSSQASVPY